MTDKAKMQLNNIILGIAGFLAMFLTYQAVESMRAVQGDIKGIRETLTEMQKISTKSEAHLEINDVRINKIHLRVNELEIRVRELEKKTSNQ